MIKFIDKEDTDRFEKACELYVEKYCKDRETAIRKLKELELLDEDGNLHPNYR